VRVAAELGLGIMVARTTGGCVLNPTAGWGAATVNQEGDSCHPLSADEYG
jgi:hypothetical protein